MYYLTERNERRTKRAAIFLTIAFHAALVAWLYVSASQKPSTTTSQSNKTEISQPTPRPKTVSQPLP